jgi:hypothetical protein
MICCPMLKVLPSADYNPKNPNKGIPGSQGALGWHDCLKCGKNKGADENKLIIKCGFEKGKIMEIESIPI